MREDDIEIIYKNLHLDFVNKYFKNKKQQQKIHKNHNEWYKFIYLLLITQFISLKIKKITLWQ